MRFGWLVLVVTMLAAPLLARDALQVWGWPLAHAARDGSDAAGQAYRNSKGMDTVQADNAGDNSGDNEGGDNSGDNEGGDNSGDNGGGDNSGDNGDNDNSGGNDNSAGFGLDLPLPSLPTRAPLPSLPTRAPQPICSRPGQDTHFTSYDGKVTVRVFGTSPVLVRVEILQVVNAYTAPSPPGTFVIPLVYEIRASDCGLNPLAAFPAEVNLAIHYTDLEAAGLDESRFEIGRLDMTTGTWVPVEKRANDLASDVVAATITETGFYMVWEAR